MKNAILVVIILAAAQVFQRCSTDVDLYAGYKDITVVYSLLDYSQDTIWAKVTRAFNGPGDVMEMAKNPDSSNYPFKLDLTLTGHVPGGNLSEIVFDTLTIKNKRAGDSIFYYPDQLMYYSVEKLNQDATYQLNLNINGKQVHSETPVVKTFDVTRPRNTIDFTQDGTIKWNSAKNGKRYEVSYIFHYSELKPGSPDILNKELVYYVGKKISISTDGGEDLSQIYSGDAFYGRLESELEPIPNVQRWAGKVDLIIGGGSQVLQNYLQINSAQGNLLEEVPLYTNIQNGTGIFASRYVATRSVKLSVLSMKKLVEDTNLGFKYPTK